MIRTLLTVTISLCATSARPAFTQEQPDLMDFVGFYELEGNHPVAISFRIAPRGMPVLIWTDLKTDAFRAMIPSGADRFQYGHALIAPEPAVAQVTFSRNDEGVVTGLELDHEGLPKVSGNRVAIETQPVEFEREDVQLKGTLFLPVGDASSRSPAIVFAHGSEDAGQRWQFDSLPWIAAAHGFVALAYDKRGTGESTGSWHAGLEVMAADAVTGLEVLRAHERVDAKRLGVIGYSEGGWLAPLIARLDGDVSFLVALSGGGMTKGDTFLHKHEKRFIDQGLDDEELGKAMAEKISIVAASARRAQSGEGNGFDLRISYDPGPDWAQFDGAVLAIMGEADILQDTPACAKWLRETLAQSKSRDWQVKVFPMAHHGMFRARTGELVEFQEMRVSQFVPGYWPTLVGWLDARHGSSGH